MNEYAARYGSLDTTLWNVGKRDEHVKENAIDERSKIVLI